MWLTLVAVACTLYVTIVGLPLKAYSTSLDESIKDEVNDRVESDDDDEDRDESSEANDEEEREESNEGGVRSNDEDKNEDRNENDAPLSAVTHSSDPNYYPILGDVIDQVREGDNSGNDDDEDPR